MATQLGALKRIRGFQGFNVDGFNYQGPDIVAYFLTHFHSDHTCGLHAGFKGPAPIYCSPVTGALLTQGTLYQDLRNVRAVFQGKDVRFTDAGSGRPVTFIASLSSDGSTKSI